MNRPTFRRLLAAPLALVLLLGIAATASAHEHREVGDYTLVVGFGSEPALVNEPNTFTLEVFLGTDEDGTPVEGLQDTLQAEVSFADQTQPLELSAAFGQPGAYKADIFPTAEGAYTFHVFGTIEGTNVDESFTSGPDTFSEVESVDAIAFPAVTDSASGGSSAVSDAQDKADSAQTLAIIGIIAGVLGLVAGGVSIMMAMNARSARTSTGAVTPEPGD